jgi:hypothetical protein
MESGANGLGNRKPARGRRGQRVAELVIASWEGGRFVRSPDSSRWLRQVNKAAALQYAPTISSDELTLYFTRFDRHAGFKGPQIYRATRSGIGAPFHVVGLGDYVEGSALSADERLLYFHRKDGKRFNLYAVPVQ